MEILVKNLKQWEKQAVYSMQSHAKQKYKEHWLFRGVKGAKNSYGKGNEQVVKCTTY